MADIMVDSVTTGIDLNETKAVEAVKGHLKMLVLGH